MKVCRAAPALFEPVGPGLNKTWFKSFSKFDGHNLQPFVLAKDPIFTALKDLNLLKRYIKNQECNYFFRISFTLSKYT